MEAHVFRYSTKARNLPGDRRGYLDVWISIRLALQKPAKTARWIPSKMLREIMRIPHPFFSRVSNKDVLNRSGQKALTIQLQRQQLLMFGRVARAPDDDVRRRLTFSPGKLAPEVGRRKRRVGRPRAEWAPKLLDLANGTWGSEKRVTELLANPLIWKLAVSRIFS